MNLTCLAQLTRNPTWIPQYYVYDILGDRKAYMTYIHLCDLYDIENKAVKAKYPEEIFPKKIFQFKSNTAIPSYGL